MWAILFVATLKIISYLYPFIAERKIKCKEFLDAEVGFFINYANTIKHWFDVFVDYSKDVITNSKGSADFLFFRQLKIRVKLCYYTYTNILKELVSHNCNWPNNKYYFEVMLCRFMLIWTIGLSAHANDTQSNDLNIQKQKLFRHSTHVFFSLWDHALTGLLVQAFQFYIAFWCCYFPLSYAVLLLLLFYCNL